MKRLIRDMLISFLLLSVDREKLRCHGSTRWREHHIRDDPMERWVMPAGTSTSEWSSTLGSFLWHELWKSFDPNENLPLVFVLDHSESQCSACHANSHLRAGLDKNSLSFFGNRHVYRHIESMGKKTIRTGRSPFSWTFIFENSLFCPLSGNA